MMAAEEEAQFSSLENKSKEESECLRLDDSSLLADQTIAQTIEDTSLVHPPINNDTKVKTTAPSKNFISCRVILLDCNEYVVEIDVSVWVRSCKDINLWIFKFWKFKCQGRGKKIRVYNLISTITFELCACKSSRQLMEPNITSLAAASESTFKKLNTCGVSNNRLYFFYLQLHHAYCETLHVVMHCTLWYITFCETFCVVLWDIAHCETLHFERHCTLWDKFRGPVGHGPLISLGHWKY